MAVTASQKAAAASQKKDPPQPGDAKKRASGSRAILAQLCMSNVNPVSLESRIEHGGEVFFRSSIIARIFVSQMSD
jgi:hypothetical protein